MRPRIPSETPQPHTEDRNKSRLFSTAAMASVLAIMAGTAVLAKKCAPKGTTPEPAAASADAKNESGNDADKTSRHRFATTIYALREQTFEPDAGANSADNGAPDSEPDAGTKPLSLEQACQQLWMAKAGTGGEIYSALRAVTDALSTKGTPTAMHEFFNIVNSCRFEKGELSNILAVAIEQGDSRVAELIHTHIRGRCIETKQDLTIAQIKQDMRETMECIDMPSASPYSVCLDEKIRNPEADTECGDLPRKSPYVICEQAKTAERAERTQKIKAFNETCFESLTGKMGIDPNKIREMTASMSANLLATSRLAFLTPDYDPTEEEIKQYTSSLAKIMLFYSSPQWAQEIEAIFHVLGVQNEAEFQKKYVEDVTEALSARGEEYISWAVNLESIWELKDILSSRLE